MRRVFTPVAVLAFISLACSAGAVDNTSTAKHEEPADARLSQKVTYEAKHKPVKVILADLSSMIGVTLNAGASLQDWQVRDRRMTIFVKDLPLLNLMNSMGRVMGFIWTKNDKVDPPTYRMYMDRKALAAAEAAKRRAEEEEKRYLTEQRTKFVNYLKDLPDYSPAELEKLKEENPSLYVMHQCGTDRLAGALFKEVPGYEEAFISAERILNPPTSILSQDTVNALLQAMKGRQHIYAMRFGSSNQEFPTDVDLKALENATVRLTVPATDVIHLDRRWLWGGIEARIPDKNGTRGFFTQMMMDPESPISQLYAGVDIEALDGNQPTEARWSKYREERDRLVREDLRELEKLWGCEPPTEHPDEPWLHEKVELKPAKDEPDRLPNVLETLAEASKMNVISDSFAMRYNYGTVSPGKQEIKAALDGISEYYGYNWDKRGKTLEFRDRDWFRRRSVQIPDEWLERWRENFRKNGTAVLEDIAQMAALSVEQFDENINTDPLFLASPDFVWTIRNSRMILRVYNSFTPSQRRLLLKGGVGLGMLTPEQWQLALDAFQPSEDRWGVPRFWEETDESLSFVGAWEPPKPEGPEFSMRVIGTDQKVHFIRRITLRKLVELPKKESKPDEAQKTGATPAKHNAAKQTLKRP